jgi:hypothetical protein
MNQEAATAPAPTFSPTSYRSSSMKSRFSALIFYQKKGIASSSAALIDSAKFEFH